MINSWLLGVVLTLAPWTVTPLAATQVPSHGAGAGDRVPRRVGPAGLAAAPAAGDGAAAFALIVLAGAVVGEAVLWRSAPVLRRPCGSDDGPGLRYRAHRTAGPDAGGQPRHQRR